jgi:hypothetical protein
MNSGTWRCAWRLRQPARGTHPGDPDFPAEQGCGSRAIRPSWFHGLPGIPIVPERIISFGRIANLARSSGPSKKLKKARFELHLTERSSLSPSGHFRRAGATAGMAHLWLHPHDLITGYRTFLEKTGANPAPVPDRALSGHFCSCFVLELVWCRLRRLRKLSPWSSHLLHLTLIGVQRRNQASPSRKTWTTRKLRRPIMVIGGAQIGAITVASVDAFTGVITTTDSRAILRIGADFHQTV